MNCRQHVGLNATKEQTEWGKKMGDKHNTKGNQNNLFVTAHLRI